MWSATRSGGSRPAHVESVAETVPASRHRLGSALETFDRSGGTIAARAAKPPKERTMRASDIEIFRAAGHNLRLWILVRAGSAEILERHVGKPDRTPKPIEVKAKTADVKSHPLAGLVVNPHLRPEAYSPRRMPTVQDCWRHTTQDWLRRPHGAPQPYEVIEDRSSPDYGCLVRHTVPCNGGCTRFGCAKKIHGDYDLYDVVDPKKYTENTARAIEVTRMHTDQRSALVDKVADYVNPRIGVPMVQHGAQFQYAGHSDEPLEVFSPKGKHSQTRGLADNEALYAVTYRGREEI